MGILGLAMIVLGLWFADREYVHLLDSCIYIHNFTLNDKAVPTYQVAFGLCGAGAGLLASAFIVVAWVRAPLRRSQP